MLVISMEREAKRNAIDRAMADALDDALNELDDDDSLWAGVLTGGVDVFSAGQRPDCRGRLQHRRVAESTGSSGVDAESR